jgi:hypothetical protein
MVRAFLGGKVTMEAEEDGRRTERRPERGED